MRIAFKLDWLLRAALCAAVSGYALHLNPNGLEVFYWAPGLAFSLLVVTARSRRPEPARQPETVA